MLHGAFADWSTTIHIYYTQLSRPSVLGVIVPPGPIPFCPNPGDGVGLGPRDASLDEALAAASGRSDSSPALDTLRPGCSVVRSTGALLHQGELGATLTGSTHRL